MIDPHAVDYSSIDKKVLDETGRLRVARQIFGVLKIHLQDRNLSKLELLDYGCSGGIITNFLSQYFGEIVGVDVDKQAIIIAKRNYQAPNLEFQLVNSEEIPFPDDSFDIVVNNQVYQYVRDAQQMMGEIHRVLKPGGICFFGARNKWGIMEPQYKLPFAHWLPQGLADFYVKITRKGDFYYGKYQNYWQLKKLCQDFKIHDYTIKILQDPERFDYLQLLEVLSRASLLINLTPKPFWAALKFFIPNYVWILEKI